MRILMVHNYYQQRGGEDESTDQELRLLSRFGHDVQLFSRHNDEINTYSFAQKTLLYFEPSWSFFSYKQILQEIHQFRPDIVHVQNFFALLSPAVFFACTRNNIPVVFTLRDYRLLCPIGWFFRDGKICEDCLSGSLWNGIYHKCYHQSAFQTSSIALLLKSHRIFGTWHKKINMFIALTEFSRMKFIEGGLPSDKIVVRPNFLEQDPGIEDNTQSYFIFIGRLSIEKGLDVLLNAWKLLPSIPLKIIGDGPLRGWIDEFIVINQLDNVEVLGFQRMEDVLTHLKDASCLLMPSKWYETFGRTIIEAYATSTPVISSKLGAMEDIVKDHETGLFFTPGDSHDLVEKVNYAKNHPLELKRWGRNARIEYESNYSDSIAYNRILEIYNSVLKS